jgi:lipopolysaccharide export system protein LptA
MKRVFSNYRLKIETWKRRPHLSIRSLLLFISVFILSIPLVSATVQEKEKKKSPTLVLESADSNENSYSNGEFISVLKGKVIFTYDDIKVRSDEATWWRNQGVIDFVKNVIVTRGSQKITCDRMHFTKDGNLLTASGQFLFVDTTERTIMSGQQAEYFIQSKCFTLKGNPRLVRYDTTSAETLTIVGSVMNYVDSLKKATVSEDVVIKKGKLTSKCRFAHYLTDSNFAMLRVNPEVYYDQNKVTGDSVNLVFGKESLKKAMVTGHSHGIYIDTSANSRSDTGITHIWGDSLLMTVSDSGMLDSLWTYGKALSRYYLSSSPDNVNEASGKKMLMDFGGKGIVKNVKIWGNARSKYYVDEGEGKGTNEASGDSIAVVFRKGKASVLSLAGKARGIYYPRSL